MSRITGIALFSIGGRFHYCAHLDTGKNLFGTFYITQGGKVGGCPSSTHFPYDTRTEQAVYLGWVLPVYPKLTTSYPPNTPLDNLLERVNDDNNT